MLDSVNVVIIGMALYVVALIAAGVYVYRGPSKGDKMFGALLISMGVGLAYIPGSYLFVMGGS